MIGKGITKKPNKIKTLFFFSLTILFRKRYKKKVVNKTIIKGIIISARKNACLVLIKPWAWPNEKNKTDKVEVIKLDLLLSLRVNFNTIKIKPVATKDVNKGITISEKETSPKL